MSSKQSEKVYSTSKRVVRQDRMMRQIIRIGGMGIIISVLGIFVFILSQVLPLFFKAEVQRVASFHQNPGALGAIGLDEWGEIPFMATANGRIAFFRSNAPSQAPEWVAPFETNNDWKFYRYLPDSQRLLYGNALGQARWIQLKFSPNFDQDQRKINFDWVMSPIFDLQKTATDPEAEEEAETGTGANPTLLDLALGGQEDGILLAALVQMGDQTQVHILPLLQEETMMGSGDLKPGNPEIISDPFPSKPRKLQVNESGNAILVALDSGEIQYFISKNHTWTKQQSFVPFQGLPNPSVASMDLLLGGASVYLTHSGGKNVVFSLLIPHGETERRWVQVKSFPDLPGAAEKFAKSLRNRAFLVTSGPHAALNYGTTEAIRWEEDFSGPLLGAALSKKYHRLALFEAPDALHLYDLIDPHPEGGWKAFFGKIWYEGAPGPEYTWQSSGGSDAFEPKLSLIPLIVGTLKGTLYAMLFAVPISLLAAVYTSQFLDPNLKKVIKPIMEIMASLPSVILGFLAALWLAPRIENAVPSLILVILVLPPTILAFGALWQKLPQTLKTKLKPGREWLLLLPMLCLFSWLAWEAGPILEKWVFTVPDPQTGGVIADFRLWWTAKTGSAFEQRNSLVVGLIMGFAVIPIVFTLAEDSLAAVPNSLRSAALALGASRWQTAFKVILPAATAGIFSAIIIGFGRAVGETMIVLMATGNTPILDFDIFSGMRTLSANLAVELPEAPFHSTLYRALFLGSLVLFLMTFGVNSIAEMMRQRIRKKFKAL